MTFQQQSIFKSQPLSKVQLKGQSEITKVQFSKVQFQKTNFKRQISSRVSNVKFSKRNFPNPILIQIFKVKFRRSTRGYQSVLFKVHHSLKVKQFKFKRSKVKRFKVQFRQTGTFQKPTFSKSSQLLVSVRSRADKEEKVRFENRFAVCFFPSRENLVHQRAKNWLSINSDVRKIADSPLPASSRRQSRATYDWLR